MAAPLWDALSKVASIAQLLGIHAFMLIGIGERLLRISCNRRTRNKLEKSVSSLRVLLHQLVPYTDSEIMLRHSHIWNSAARTVEAAGRLLDEHRSSTLWVRVCAGRGMSVRLGDMYDRVKSSHSLVELFYRHVLLMHPDAAILPPPAPDTTIAT